MTDKDEKTIRRRLKVLQLADKLGNVSEACLRTGISRTQFYEYKRRFEAQGIEGLRNLPTIHKSHPQTTPQDVVDKILDLSIEHPLWGCGQLSRELRSFKISVSSPTIQNILIKHEMGSQHKRLLKLEDLVIRGKIEPSEEQGSAIEKLNPCFRERHRVSLRPGELLAQVTFYIGHLKDIGRVYIQALVDTYSSYGFSFLHTGKLPEHAIAVLHDKVLPQYKAWKIEVDTILTTKGPEYTSRGVHPYEVFLAMNNIKHRKEKGPQKNGFIERFYQELDEEFFRRVLQKKHYKSLKSLKKDLDSYLAFYNSERPYRGYRNMGRSPGEMVHLFLNPDKDN